MPFPLYYNFPEKSEQKDFPVRKEVKLLARHAGHRPFREFIMAMWLGAIIAMLSAWPIGLLQLSVEWTSAIFFLFWWFTTGIFWAMFRMS